MVLVIPRGDPMTEAMERLAILVLGPGRDRHRAQQVEHAMNRARAISAVAILAVVPLFLAGRGWWPIVAVGIWLGWSAVASLQARRSAYPELWLLSLTIVTQTVFAIAAYASGGPTSPVLAWFILPLVTAPARYTNRVVAVSSTFALLCLGFASLGHGLAPFLAAPQLPAVVLSAGIGSLAYCLAMRTTENDQRAAALFDPLTGLGNRAALRAAFEEHRARCAAHGASIGLLVADLDHFKVINDAYGHETGDVVLARVARTLRSAAGEGASAFRLGGEEFVVLLPGASAARVHEAAEALRCAVRQVDPAEVPVTISIGGASASAAETDQVELFRMADAALYDAKRRGRDRVVVWSASAPAGDGNLPAAA